MDIVGLGVDLVDVERVRRLMGRRKSFTTRVFTPPEIEYCERQANPPEYYAARWAAREACRKALGGVRGMLWHDVRVARAPSGAPSLVLTGATAHRARMLGVTEVKVALTHERSFAAAFCVAVRA